MYAYPWLASLQAYLPTLLAAGFASPFAVPPGMFPSSQFMTSHLPIQDITKPTSDQSSSDVQCTICQSNFKSLQQLADHIKETMHYPPMMDPNSWYRQNTTNPSSPSLATPPSQSPSGSTSSSGGRVKSKSSDDIIKPPPQSSSASSSDDTPASFDFIKSLESTIQSAISKVESPRTNRKMPTCSTAVGSNRLILQSHQKQSSAKYYQYHSSVAPSMSSMVSKHQQINSVGTKMTLNSTLKHSPQARDNAINSKSKSKRTEKTCSEETPLDLTVKKPSLLNDNLPSSPGKGSQFSPYEVPNNHSPRTREDLNKFHAYSGSFPKKDPLMSIKQTMDSLFTPHKYYQGNSPSAVTDFKYKRQHHNGISKENRMKTTNKSLPFISASTISSSESTNSSDPLTEMMKVVNKATKFSTNVAASKPSISNEVSKVGLIPSSATKKRRSDDNFFLNSNLKRSKLTEFLYDLVVPKEEPVVSSSSSDNPLRKMQDLVNMKLTTKQGTTKQQHVSPTPSSGGYPNSMMMAFNNAKQPGLSTSVVNAAGSLLALSSSVSSPSVVNNCKSPEKSPTGNGKCWYNCFYLSIFVRIIFLTTCLLATTL